jgi:two-component system chemotaxis response regulator CheB
MEKCPRPIIIHSTLVSPEQTENIFKAMKAGAVAVSQKPPGMAHPESKDLVDKLLRTIKLMSEVKVVRLLKQPKKETKSLPDPLKISAESLSGNGIIAIGASTGGPPVIQTLLSGLNPDFRIPIVIVQHIAKGFLEGMVEWLAKTTPLTLKIPKTGDSVSNGHVYFAPEEFLTDITPSRIFRLYPSRGHENARRPISHLFSSVAKTFKKNAVGILLTGMGADGAIGLWKMKEQGAMTLVQDRNSSVVFGMPGEAVRINAETYILQPEEIAGFLNMREREIRS